MTIYRAQVLEAPEDPFRGGVLRAEADAGLLVTADGQIADRGPFAEVRARHTSEPVSELPDGLLLPGFVDTHVHFPQARIIGDLGMPLLDWLDRSALPEEARFADLGYAQEVAGEFVSGLADAGTTTALVFGAHFRAGGRRAVYHRVPARPADHQRVGGKRPAAASGAAHHRAARL